MALLSLAIELTIGGGVGGGGVVAAKKVNERKARGERPLPPPQEIGRGIGVFLSTFIASTIAAIIGAGARHGWRGAKFAGRNGKDYAARKLAERRVRNANRGIDTITGGDGSVAGHWRRDAHGRRQWIGDYLRGPRRGGGAPGAPGGMGVGGWFMRGMRGSGTGGRMARPKSGGYMPPTEWGGGGTGTGAGTGGSSGGGGAGAGASGGSGGGGAGGAA